MLVVWAEETFIPLMQSLQKLILEERREETGVDKRLGWRKFVLFKSNLKRSLSVQTRTRIFCLTVLQSVPVSDDAEVRHAHLVSALRPPKPALLRSHGRLSNRVVAAVAPSRLQVCRAAGQLQPMMPIVNLPNSINQYVAITQLYSQSWTRRAFLLIYFNVISKTNGDYYQQSKSHDPTGSVKHITC